MSDLIYFVRSWIAAQSRRARIVWVVILLALVATGAFRRPLLHQFRVWRAEQLLAQAVTQAERDDWEEVRRLATASLQSQPSLGAMRQLTKAYERGHDPQLLQLAVAVFRHPEASPPDRSEVLRVLLDYDDLLTVAGMVRSLPSRELEQPATRFQFIRFLLRTGEFRQATEIVDSLPDEQRRPDLQLLLAEGMARGGRKEARGAIASRLQLALASQDRETTLRGLRLLVSLPDDWIHQTLAEAVMERLGSDPNLASDDRLRLDLLRIALMPDERARIIETAISTHRGRHDDELLKWLDRLGEMNRIVELTATARESGAISAVGFELRARALEALGRFDDLAKELQDPPAAIKDVPLICSRAALATLRARESEAVVLWREALDVAGREPSRNWFYLVSRIAGRAGDKEIEMEALARGIEEDLGRPPLTEELGPLFDWLYKRDETERLMKISARLLQREPGNPTLINNYLYLKALHFEVSPADLQTLRSLVTAFPREPNFRGSLAFALLRSGKPSEAIEVFDSFPSGTRPNNEGAVRAAALASLDRRREATGLADQIDWTGFSPFEAKILKALAIR